MLICLFKVKRPDPSQLFSLFIVAMGVVIGFPLLTAMALQHVTSSHSIVFLGLLPLATAVFGVIRGGERPRRAFWLFSLCGSLLVVGFALSHLAAVSLKGDLLMLASVIVCGLGYAEGAKLSRELGGWQVISWALIISLPIMLIASYFTVPPKPHQHFSLTCAGLCLAFQHADWFYFLVQRARYRWNCRCRATAVAPAIFWTGSVGFVAARERQPADDSCHAWRHSLRHRFAKMCVLIFMHVGRPQAASSILD